MKIRRTKVVCLSTRQTNFESIVIAAGVAWIVGTVPGLNGHRYVTAPSLLLRLTVNVGYISAAYVFVSFFCFVYFALYFWCWAFVVVVVVVAETRDDRVRINNENARPSVRHK